MAMADLTIVDKYPKASVSKEDVVHIQQGRLTNGGAKSCTLTEDNDFWILTTVWPGIDAGSPTAASAATAAVAATATATAPPAAAAGAPSAPGSPGQSGPPIVSSLDAATKAFVKLAIQNNEIGLASPYVISFAGKGQSGGSFGAMQGDLAVGQKFVVDAFRGALETAGVSGDQIGGILGQLCVHCAKNPLTLAVTTKVNEALKESSAQVDKMDDSLLDEIYASLRACLEAAQSSGRAIDREALLYMGAWINMSGPPTTLLAWLKGDTASLYAALKGAPAIVTGSAIRDYLSATRYFAAHPQNLQRLQSCVTAALKNLRA
jgi:hypothetical protein